MELMAGQTGVIFLGKNGGNGGGGGGGAVPPLGREREGRGGADFAAEWAAMAATGGNWRGGWRKREELTGGAAGPTCRPKEEGAG